MDARIRVRPRSKNLRNSTPPRARLDFPVSKIGRKSGSSGIGHQPMEEICGRGTCVAHTGKSIGQEFRVQRGRFHRLGGYCAPRTLCHSD